MDIKLTVKLDEDIINRAKSYAKHKHTSLSRMIEAYLDDITKDEKAKVEITPLVKSLIGVAKLPPDYDYKKERAKHLEKKHR
jgi:hypothetical protein